MRHVFPNGLELIYQNSNTSVPITSIYIFCKVGSAYETDGIRGASHFVEHMCFKGTEKVKQAKNLLLKYNTLGVNVNAYTVQQHTCYYLTCDNIFFKESFHLLEDVLLNSTFPKKEFAKEQHVVVEENIRKQDNNMDHIMERVESIYFKGSSYQYPVDSIKYHPTATYLKYDDINDWYKWFYVPSNMIISIVSRIPFSHILKAIENSQITQTFKQIRKPPFALSSPYLHLSPIPAFSVDYFHKKGINATMISVGFRTCSHGSKDEYPLDLLKCVMNGLSGRLFTEFRTKHGLTYRSTCMVDNRENTGYFSIFLQTDPSKLLTVLSILIGLLHDIKMGISNDEIKRAKSVLKGKLLRSMETIDTITTYNGIEAIYGKEFVPYQHLYSAHYAKITKKQVDDVIHRYFIKENMVACILYDKAIPKSKIDALFRV